MSDKDEAAAFLAAHRDPAWHHISDAIESLAGPIRDAARAIVGLGSTPGEWSILARPAILALDEVARAELVGFLFPGNEETVGRAWRDLERSPYQSPWTRSPFRAPGREDVLGERRADWLAMLFQVIGPYRQPPSWFVTVAPQFDAIFPGSHCSALYIFLAAAIDDGGAEGERVFGLLCETARESSCENGGCDHVIHALLAASRPDGWECIERLLASSQDEGMRWPILLNANEAHPEAFRRLLRLILERGLAQFSSVARMVDVWLGLDWETVSTATVNRTVEQLLQYLDDPSMRTKALGGGDAGQAFLSLWAQAFDDATAAAAEAQALLTGGDVAHRFIAARVLSDLQLPESPRALLDALNDDDLRVAAVAVDHFGSRFERRAPWPDTKAAPTGVAAEELSRRLEALLLRFPRERTALEPLVWAWTGMDVSTETVTRVLLADGLGADPMRLAPYLHQMSVGSRIGVAYELARPKRWTDGTRAVLLGLMSDASAEVRRAAIKGFAQCVPTDAEARDLERLLTRSGGELRTGVLAALRRQADAQVLAAADRLLVSKHKNQRLAGLELLRGLVEEKRAVAVCHARAARVKAGTPDQSASQHLDAILRAEEAAPTLLDALGLVRHDERTWPEAPVDRGTTLHSSVAERIVREYLKSNARQLLGFVSREDGSAQQGRLGQLRIKWPDDRVSVAEDRRHLPLADELEAWWDARDSSLRDDDGMELPRTIAWYHAYFSMFSDWKPDALCSAYPAYARAVFGDVAQHEQDLVRKKELERRVAAGDVRALLRWLVRLRAHPASVDFVLDAYETSMAIIPGDFLTSPSSNASREQILARRTMQQFAGDWRGHESPPFAWGNTVRWFYDYCPGLWTPEQVTRYWRLSRWVDEPIRPSFAGGAGAESGERLLPRQNDDFTLTLGCHVRALGSATDADLMEHLIGERNPGRYAHVQFSQLGRLTHRAPSRELAQWPFLSALVERCRNRVLEVELARGDAPTESTNAALSLGCVWGIGSLVAILRALGDRRLVRAKVWSEQREQVFSHLVRRSFPRSDETGQQFAAKVGDAAITESRLVEVAVFAPQWAPFVEHALGWTSLTDAVWWIHAHTKGADCFADQEMRELWAADISARTPLAPDDLVDGAVDVAWFHAVHAAIGRKRWEALYEAAKYASSGAGHVRARIFADAMLGNNTRKDLLSRITQQRQQDAVRALGLLPLAAGRKRDADVLDRYHAIHEFVRGSRVFGSQRQASERRAAQIALDNLARNAGYRDPIRLQWAMEARAIDDLADGPITVSVDAVTASLGIDAWGEVAFTVTKDGKRLAGVPAKMQKEPRIAAVRARKAELSRQAARIRPSLEELMIRGDTISGTELRELMQHPLLRPMLGGLVLTGDGAMGYPAAGGASLEDCAGKVTEVSKDAELRIAHPLDLMPAKAWHRWQRECFARERIQPFKQVFRELYVLTDAERAGATLTRRYAGQQLEQRQALALLGRRGWVHHPDEGVRKTFHRDGLMAWMECMDPFGTPPGPEAVTVEAIHFFSRATEHAVALGDVPPRLFSEAMRDLDLVVSVAHFGDVDPEATASTVELRAALVEQAGALLKLSNVTVRERHVLIEGTRARYTVHLGSAVVHASPGGMLNIVPVHGELRGRLFLPFADDDPRTAEVVSKVLLLARDGEITDPAILAQLERR